jgi:hypothetical protein
LSSKRCGDGLFLERPKCLGVAKKIGDADQQVAKERGRLDRHFLQVARVLGQPFDLVDRHAAFDSAEDGALLVLRKIVAGLGPEQDENSPQRAFRKVG